MIEKHLARDLLPLVNTDSYDLLMQYVADRISRAHKDLENAPIDKVQYVQGQIKELRLLEQLRDRVQQDSKG